MNKTEVSCLKASVALIGERLAANVGLSNDGIKASIGLVGERLKANVGIICTPHTDIYIRVSPDVLWFFKEGEILDVDVVSNIKWIVK
jgi:hypothetical protein